MLSSFLINLRISATWTVFQVNKTPNTTGNALRGFISRNHKMNFFFLKRKMHLTLSGKFVSPSAHTSATVKQGHFECAT